MSWVRKAGLYCNTLATRTAVSWETRILPATNRLAKHARERFNTLPLFRDRNLASVDLPFKDRGKILGQTCNSFDNGAWFILRNARLGREQFFDNNTKMSSSMIWPIVVVHPLSFRVIFMDAHMKIVYVFCEATVQAAKNGSRYSSFTYPSSPLIRDEEPILKGFPKSFVNCFRFEENGIVADMTKLKTITARLQFLNFGIKPTDRFH